MRTYLCSRTPKNENSKRIDNREEFLNLFRDFADSASDEAVRFEFSKRYYVEIARAKSEGFFLNCLHEQHSFETLVPYDGVKTGFTIEEFLDDFWHHRVRQKYNFDENVEMRHASFTAKFRFRWITLFPLLFFVLPFVFYFIENKPFNPEATKNFIWIELAATTPYWILLLQYLYYSWSAELRISNREKLVIFTKGNSESAIRFSEITQIRIISNGSRPFMGSWRYMRIVAGPQKRIIVTDLVYEELEKIAQVLDVEPIHEASFYPLILQKKKSPQDVAEESEQMLEKAEELEERWKNKSKEELQAIIDSEDEYAAHAIEAAERLLKQRAK